MAAHAGTSPQPSVTMPTGPVMTAMQINATPVITPQMQQIHQIQSGQSVMFDPMGFVIKPQDLKIEESVEVKLEKKRKQEAEKKKKEEEEKAKQVAAKQMDKSRPISSTPIAGTPWCVTHIFFIYIGQYFISLQCQKTYSYNIGALYGLAMDESSSTILLQERQCGNDRRIF